MADHDDRWRAPDPNALADRLAQEMRLSHADMEKARAALEPVFALGLRQAMESPARWARLAEAFTAMTPQGGAPARGPAGESFLDAILGSGPLREAVSRQASVLTGISQDALARMMPQLAAIGMEAMMRNAFSTWSRGQPVGLASGDFGAATAEMMRRGANAVEAMTRPSDAGRPARFAAASTPADFFADAFGQAFQAGLGLWSRSAPAPVPARHDSASAFDPVAPFAVMFEAFAKGMQSAADTMRVPERAAPPPPSPAPRKPAPQLFDAFMQSGQKMREDYAREMTAVFDRFAEKGKSAE
ncbi:hypothetical protein [Aureimonas psammosilenae]|uniref:hypothetical protein n=1 Tax=Aureimonas psammosilenae TaxID=2495496 RepID=UPI001260AFA0|nr:hypothetical protein [Aureimonas psammosilenae]